MTQLRLRIRASGEEKPCRWQAKQYRYKKKIHDYFWTTFPVIFRSSELFFYKKKISASGLKCNKTHGCRVNITACQLKDQYEK